MVDATVVGSSDTVDISTYTGDPVLVEQEVAIAAHLDSQRLNTPDGVYLDDVRRVEAETRRAIVEGREPDYDNAGTTAGDQVVVFAEFTKNLPGDVILAIPEDVRYVQERMVGVINPEDTTYSNLSNDQKDTKEAELRDSLKRLENSRKSDEKTDDTKAVAAKKTVSKPA